MNIQELITAELNKEQEVRKGRERSGKFSPSMLGRCFRAQWWNRKNEPSTETIPDRNLRVLKAGNIFHWWVQRIVLENNPNIQKEVIAENDDFKGFADLVNGDEVIDLKTVHSGAFTYMDTKTIVKDKFTNWLQVMFYCLILGKKYGKLSFISKDDLRIEEFRQELDDYWKGELDMEFTHLNHYWKHNKLPPATPRAYIDKKTGKPKECQYCSWLTKCNELEKGEKK